VANTRKIVFELTEDEALMLADYLNYSKADDGGEIIITNETIKFVTSLIPLILDAVSQADN